MALLQKKVGTEAKTTVSSDDQPSSARHLFFGGVYIGLGLAAMILPQLATITISLLLGLFLFASGILQTIQTFQTSRVQDKTVSLMTAVVYLAFGGLLLFETAVGAATLTFLIGLLFLFIGILRFLYALRLDKPQSRWMLAGASAAFLLGAAILASFSIAGAHLWLLGFLVGADLIFVGVNSLYWGYYLRREKEETVPQDRGPRDRNSDDLRPAS